MTDGPRVAVQFWQRHGRAGRWGYVLHIPGEWPWVSAYRWASAEAAQAAGERDLAGTLAAEAAIPDLD